MHLATGQINLGGTKTAGSSFRRAATKSKYDSSTTWAKWSLSPLGLLCALLALEVCLSRTNVAKASDTNMSIDEVLMEAFNSSNERGLMNSPGIVRVQIDMLFVEEDWLALIREHDNHDHGRSRKIRKAIRNEAFRWPNGQVPYIVDTSFNSLQMQQLAQAIEEFNRYTCIRFRSMTPPRYRDFVRIASGKGCASFVGRQGGEQYLSLAPHCRTKRVIVHELAHAIGCVHEHSRSDRDDYVTIKIENVQPDHKDDYEKFSWNSIDAAGIPYDYTSVMHYGATAGAFKNKTAIETKNVSYQGIIGKGSTFSFNDVKLINKMYRCSELNKCRRKVCPGEGFVGHDCSCWCPSGIEEIPAVKCPGCFDFNEYCPYFKARGLCNKGLYRDYLLDVCPMSCGSCTGSGNV